jgi:hypothetical protein
MHTFSERVEFNVTIHYQYYVERACGFSGFYLGRKWPIIRANEFPADPPEP